MMSTAMFAWGVAVIVVGMVVAMLVVPVGVVLVVGLGMAAVWFVLGLWLMRREEVPEERLAQQEGADEREQRWMRLL